MRERFIQIIIVLLAFIGGFFAAEYFTNSNTQTENNFNKKLTIKEDNSISSSISKVYDAVVVVESFSGDTQTASGSGFIYKKDNQYGYIMTNYHVVDGAEALKIVTSTGEEVDAEYLGGDSYADIAVVRINKDKVLAVASIGDSSKSVLGDTVFTVGTPVGSEYQGTVTKGIVSGAGRTVTVNNKKGSYMMEVIQTDASINPGNSGGPLVNINGEVIGVTSMKLVTDDIEGMGFAIPIEIAMASTDKLEKGEKIERPYIGVSLFDISNKGMLYRFNMQIDNNVKEGVVVTSVEKNSPAEEAGIEANDIITEVDGTKVKSSAHFKFVLYKHEVGDTAKITINRNGKNKTITIKLDKAQGD